ncbi:hypothetical protein AbraIFM66951_008169 [Aspergillus brasiliensis]|uniref:Uncharacterized protein n=1 Tax=Aspergillus brasiliensis TaxID=319629 RepID=A0A9W5YPV3_9EURO|nr:hypothetical protein AbraCBS73388_005288 [Aspergillus brasiliensis]GKZ45516.1 hypothetical protein AbraIFM66951_008169 [Aspergillus brasiliensis]
MDTLLDQFTQDTANRRGGRWGGNVDDKSRFGVENVGYRISPHGDFQGMRMEKTCPQFEVPVTKLVTLSLAYLQIVAGRMNSAEDSNNPASIES